MFQGLDAGGVEGRGIDAEAGVHGLGLAGKEAQQMRAVPGRAHGRDLAPGHAAIGPVAPERKMPRAQPVPLQGRDQPGHEPRQRCVQPVPVDQRLRQGQALDADGRRDHGRDRLGAPAQRLVEA